MPDTPRGRPRSQASRNRVLQAARELLAQGGLGAVTIEALSASTGVSRPTIYRSWPNAQAVAMAALMQAPPPPPGPPASLRDALLAVIGGLIDSFATPAGRSAARLIAASDPGTELSRAFRNHVLLDARARVREVLSTAQAGGALAPVDLDLAADLLVAPVVLRLLLGHQPLGPDLGPTLIDQVLAGMAPRPLVPPAPPGYIEP